MKLFGTLLISGIIAMCFSFSATAQSSGMDLNQVELMKQFAGTWKTEIGEDSTLTWESIPFGKGYEIIVNWKAKGEPYLNAKGILGLTEGLTTVNFILLYPGGGIEKAVGEFVSKNKLELKAYNFDHSEILAKYEINFPGPDSWNAKVKVKGSAESWDDARVIKYNYSRVK